MEFVIREIELLAIIVEPADVVLGLRDPYDEGYLATAVAIGAALKRTFKTEFHLAHYTLRKLLEQGLPTE